MPAFLRSLTLVVGAAIASLGLASEAFAQPTTVIAVIQNAAMPGTQLDVYGTNFVVSGAGPASVTLGGHPAAFVVVSDGASNDQLTITIPDAVLASGPGTYQLRVSQSAAAGRTAIYEVALPATGPAGPAGPPGTLASIQAMEGLACTSNGEAGTILVLTDADGDVSFRCVVPDPDPDPDPEPDPDPDPPSCGTIYFSESFADNSRGWSLGNEWQIGSAVAGPDPGQGEPDPAADHTATADNGVAGLVIGGNYSTAIHAAAYLTSPIVDLSSAEGTVVLSFWRWLNTDYPPYTQDTLQVFNGTQWVTLWSNSPGVITSDSAWGEFQFDVTAYKNATFQVRFGHAVTSSGAFIMSGWNIDDVFLSSAACN